MPAQRHLTPRQINDFLSSHRLPESYAGMAREHFLPLARRLPGLRPDLDRPLLLGINGAQGTGKSTLADYLGLASETLHDWTVAVLSIDDFYLTRAARAALAGNVHPLLATRGVPGTHDTAMLDACLDGLCALGAGTRLALPRFDKATDDRAAEAHWPMVTGRIDLVILEGWCVGTAAQDDADLVEPVNELERDQDGDGHWRRYVNDRLRTDYEPLFDRLDALVFLEAPGFDAIFRWRLEQEQKLAAASPPGATGIMDRDQVAQFIQYYERLTRSNLEHLPEVAEFVFKLARDHSVVRTKP